MRNPAHGPLAKTTGARTTCDQPALVLLRKQSAADRTSTFLGQHSMSSAFRTPTPAAGDLA